MLSLFCFYSTPVTIRAESKIVVHSQRYILVSIISTERPDHCFRRRCCRGFHGHFCCGWRCGCSRIRTGLNDWKRSAESRSAGYRPETTRRCCCRASGTSCKRFCQEEFNLFVHLLERNSVQSSQSRTPHASASPPGLLARSAQKSFAWSSSRSFRFRCRSADCHSSDCHSAADSHCVGLHCAGCRYVGSR